MTKDELLQVLQPFDGELDLVIEKGGSCYSIDSLMYSTTLDDGTGVVRLGAGDEVDLRFRRGVELL